MSKKQQAQTPPPPAAKPEPTPASQKLDRNIGWGLFALGFFVLLFTEKAAGFVRDESVYFYAGEQYARWFQLLFSNPSQAFTDAAITQHFDFNHEHPALMKNLFGLSFVLFNEKLGWLRPAAAFRLPAFAFAALILPLTYHFIRERFSRAAGIFAAVTFLLVPRQFFEAHLSCFDVPIAAMWLLVVYCFWQAMDRKRWWLYAGLAFGLAMGTKHNAYFIPVALIPFSMWKGWERSRDNAEARSLFLSINGVFVFGALLYVVMGVAMGLEAVQAKFELISPFTGLFVIMVGVGSWLLWKLARVHEGTFFAVAPLVAMAGLGPVLFYLHWPYLWHHPVDRTAWYLAFHATHNHYAWFYLGKVLRGPPFPLDYVLVKTALTVPTSLFVPMVLGFVWMGVRAVRRQLTWLEGLIVINSLVSIALISLPSVPHFGGVKHWFPSMPFLAMLGAGALLYAARALQPELTKRGVKLTEQNLYIALAVLVSIPAVIANARVYPYGTSHYSELAGGLPGGASLGMQRQFWANNVTGVLPWINENARPGERVYFHECHGGQINDYRRNGMLRADIGIAGGPQDADIVAYQYHQEFREQEFDTWQAFNTEKPVTGLYVDETPQVVVYRRR